MHRHPLKIRIVLLTLEAIGRVLLILRCNIARDTRHPRLFLLGALENHLNSYIFALLRHGSTSIALLILNLKETLRLRLSQSNFETQLIDRTHPRGRHLQSHPAFLAREVIPLHTQVWSERTLRAPL